MFPTFFVGLAWLTKKTAHHARSAEGTTQQPKKNINAMTMDNQKRIRRCSGMRYFRQSPNLPCFFSTFSPSFASQSVPFLKIYSTCVPFQQGHLSAGIGAFQRRHWCILTHASVHLSAGTGAFQRRHWCISTQALVHFNTGTGAFQCGHWCRHWCISAQALVHLSAGIGACQWGHWCISMTTYWCISIKHWCISTGAVLRVNGNWVHWFVELRSWIVLIGC